MTVICVLSLKGGVGKTSVVLGLAGASLRRGLRTTIVDLDPQGNASSLLRARRPQATAADVLAQPTRASLEVAMTPSGWTLGGRTVNLIASDPDLIRFDAWNPGRSWSPKLARALRQLQDNDLVLIDCPPSLGALTREALAAADLAVVVTTPSYFGSQGAERAIEEVEQITASVNPNLRFAGIVVNRLREKTEEHRYRKKELVDIYGPGALLKPAIPERVAVQQAESTGQPLHEVKSSGAREVAKIFDKQLTRLLKMAKPAETAPASEAAKKP